MGLSRDDIAQETGVSAGAVSSITAQWKQSVGAPLADQLRALAVVLRKMGYTASECGRGVRLANIMNKLGVDEESFESFITETYNRSKGIGLHPEQIATYLGDLVSFSSGCHTTGLT